MGKILCGTAGAGKTHLISRLCQTVVTGGDYFIFANMEGCGNFWPKIALSYMLSLKTTCKDKNGNKIQQIKLLIDNLFKIFKIKKPANFSAKRYDISFAKNQIKSDADRIYPWINRDSQIEPIDLKKALILLLLTFSDDLYSNDLAKLWAQGREIEKPLADKLGFDSGPGRARETTVALSWLMALTRRTTVVVLDQLDDSTSLYNKLLTPEIAKSIAQPPIEIVKGVEEIVNGLGFLVNQLFRSQLIVSCLPDTWNCFKANFISPALERFAEPIFLSTIGSTFLSQAMVEKRLNLAFSENGLTPPYPTWPFTPKAFEGAADMYPRLLIRLCHAQIEKMILQGRYFEVSSLIERPEALIPVAPQSTDPAPEAQDPEATTALVPLPPVNEKFNEKKVEAQTESMVRLEPFDQLYEKCLALEEFPNYKSKTAEADFWSPALAVIAEAICLEREEDLTTPFSLCAKGDIKDFKAGLEPIQACLQLLSPNGTERSLSFKSITHKQHLHFTSRLTTAATYCGLDPKSEAWALLIVTFEEFIPSGETTKLALKDFLEANGRFYSPSPAAVKVLWALGEVKKEAKTLWPTWLKSRKPINQSGLLAKEIEWLIFGVPLTTPNWPFSHDKDPRLAPLPKAPKARPLKPASKAKSSTMVSAQSQFIRKAFK
jgi:hypothetical protein